MPKTSVYQVFLCPGAIRCSLTVQGKISPDSGSAASISNVPLSHVSQGTELPCASGRCFTMFESTARTLRGRQPARNGTCRACRPKSPSTPYCPLNSTIRFQLIGLPGSRSLECRKPVLASMIWPKACCSNSSQSICIAGKKGDSEEHAQTPGCCRNIAKIASLAGEVDPERLFTHEVLPRVNLLAIDVPVEMVRHREIDRLDLGVGKELAIILRGLTETGEMVPIPRKQ